jgi:hypothetical protein
VAAQPWQGWPGIRKSYTCAEAIVSAQAGAGVVVERRAGTDLVGIAAAGSLVVCGVAIDDVPAARAAVGGPQVGDGHEMTVFSGGFVNVIASAAVSEGQRVVATAGGQVGPAGAAPDARTVIGHADQAIAAGAVGRIFIAPGGQG